MTVRLGGSTSGFAELDAPAVAGNNRLVLPTGNGQLGQLLGGDGAGNLTWVNGSTNSPAFAVYSSTPQTITSFTATKVTLNTKEYDTASAFDSTTNFRFQPLIPGYYQFNAMIRATATTALSNAYCEIFKNGSPAFRGQELQLPAAYAGSAAQVMTNAMLFMNGSTDFIELYAVLSGTGTLSLQVINPIYTARLSGFLARPA